MKNLLYIILAVSLSSCGIYKKHILNKYCVPSSITKDSISVSKTDSTYKHKYDSITSRPAVTNEMNISNPCDSAGKLQVFEQTIVNGKDSLKIKSDGKTINVRSNCDACEQRYEALMELYYKKTDSTVVHVEYVTNVREPDYTWGEEFMLSSFGTFIMLIGLLCITVMGILIYKTIKSK